MLIYKYHYTCQATFDNARIKTPISRTGYFSSQSVFDYLMNNWNSQRGWKFYQTGDDQAMNAKPEIIMYEPEYFIGSHSVWGNFTKHEGQEVYIEGDAKLSIAKP